MTRMIDPIAVWDIRPWGSPMYCVADVNGDGKNEILFVQSAGSHANSAFDPRIPGGDDYKTGAEDQDLFCMTLTDGRGNVLWQVGKPWRLERPYSWNGDCNRFCEIADLNGDGRKEILMARKGELLLFDAATGRLLKQSKLPNEAFNYACTIKIDHSGKRHIFTKSGSTSLTHSFGNPNLILDHDFNVVWEVEVPGAGHRGCIADVDGDGLDEMLIGYTFFDHDCRVLWSHPPEDGNDHNNGAVIADLDNDGRFEIAVVHDSLHGAVHELDGRERFRVKMHKAALIASGRFFSDVPGTQLIYTDMARSMDEPQESIIVDAFGRELTRHAVNGYYEIVDWPTPLGPQSFVRLERPAALEGEFRVVWADPTGKDLARFNVRASFHEHFLRHGLDRVNPEYRTYFGGLLASCIGDIDNDGREELLINDREKVWVFRRPLLPA
jgi:hypothetical protein